MPFIHFQFDCLENYEKLHSYTSTRTQTHRHTHIYSNREKNIVNIAIRSHQSFKSPLLYFISILLEFSKVYVCLFACTIYGGKTFPCTLYKHTFLAILRHQVKMSVYHFPGKIFYYSHRFHFDSLPCIVL